VVVPSVTTLNNYAFARCSKLTSITFGTISDIPTNCFNECSLIDASELDLSNVSAIRTAAFAKTATTEFHSSVLTELEA
jgi:hypothetical protein